MKLCDFITAKNGGGVNPNLCLIYTTFITALSTESGKTASVSTGSFLPVFTSA